MTKATDEFQNLLAVKPFVPKKSAHIIKEFVKRYELDELDDTDINLDFLWGFSYAIGIIEAMLEVERNRESEET